MSWRSRDSEWGSCCKPLWVPLKHVSPTGSCIHSINHTASSWVGLKENPRQNEKLHETTNLHGQNSKSILFLWFSIIGLFLINQAANSQVMPSPGTTHLHLPPGCPGVPNRPRRSSESPLGLREREAYRSQHQKEKTQHRTVWNKGDSEMPSNVSNTWFILVCISPYFSTWNLTGNPLNWLSGNRLLTSTKTQRKSFPAFTPLEASFGW